MFPTEVQFGHAGAKANSDLETADAKNKALKEAGAIVPDSFEDYGKKIKETYEDLVKKGVIIPTKDFEVPTLPLDYNQLMKEGKLRKATTFITTISNDNKEELEYLNIPISKIVESGIGIGGVIGLLWFKRELPEFARKFIETSIILTADHGPAVSGAHNAIVAARAGKDVISSLCSGLLTIGPRFGGAIDDAARYFRKAFIEGMSPEDFVKDMKAKGIKIPGIGHRVKSLTNPDMRVSLLKDSVRKISKNLHYLIMLLKLKK